MTSSEIMSLGLAITPNQADLIAEVMNLKRAFERLDSNHAGQLVQSAASIALAKAIMAQAFEMRALRQVQQTEQGGHDVGANA